MKRIDLIKSKKISREVEEILERQIKESGTGAVIYMPKAFIDRKAIIGILPEDLNICDKCGKPLFCKSKEDAIKRDKDKKFAKKFCNCKG